MSRLIRAGVIGLGSIAHIAELPALSEMADVQIVAAFDRSEDALKKAASKYNIESLHTNFDKFLEIPMDCAFVMTPKTLHTPFVSALLEHKIDVFCEKPIAQSLKEGKMLLELAKKHDRIFMIGFNRRYAPVYQKAKAAFSDRVPDVFLAQKSRNGSELHATLENAIHMVDLMRWFCGESVKVEAHSQFDNPDYETTCTAQVTFDSGAIGVLVANRGAGQWIEKAEIYGGGQTAIVNAPDSVTIVKPDHEESVNMTPLALGWARVPDKMGFCEEVRHFIDCVKSHTQPLTNAEDAYKSHELMNQILLAAGLPGMDA